MLDIVEVLGILSALAAYAHWSSMLVRCVVWLHGVVTVVMLLVAVIYGVF